MSGPLRNKISESGLITINVLDFMPKSEGRGLDLKEWLIDDLIIRERDFKVKLESFDFTTYKNTNVFIHCSIDVIIPVWAFLLLQTKLNNIANYVFFGTKNEMNLVLFKKRVDLKLNVVDFSEKRVFIKGCGDPLLPLGAFSIVAQKLIPIVKSLFYGEACSSVPLIKNM